MIALLRREFIVDVPPEQAWQQLARLGEWPGWAKHIKQIQVQPPGDLGPTSVGTIYLTNGFKTVFRVTEFNPYRNWKWVARLLWMMVHYDHWFEAITPARTKMTWIVAGSGLGAGTLGRLFAKVYSKSLDRAIPLLIEDMSRARTVAPR
jgi:hypothetical protein